MLHNMHSRARCIDLPVACAGYAEASSPLFVRLVHILPLLASAPFLDLGLALCCVAAANLMAIGLASRAILGNVLGASWVPLHPPATGGMSLQLARLSCLAQLLVSP